MEFKTRDDAVTNSMAALPIIKNSWTCSDAIMRPHA
jgi:hypothetical protein